MMISNDRRMPSSADLHGKTEEINIVNYERREANSQWKGIPIDNGRRKE